MSSNLYLITDSLPGESNIIPDNCTSDLVITDLDGTERMRIPAVEPWTHSSLTAVIEDIGNFPDGANAFLTKELIGSTEI